MATSHRRGVTGDAIAVGVGGAVAMAAVAGAIVHATGTGTVAVSRSLTALGHAVTVLPPLLTGLAAATVAAEHSERRIRLAITGPQGRRDVDLTVEPTGDAPAVVATATAILAGIVVAGAILPPRPGILALVAFGCLAVGAALAIGVGYAVLVQYFRGNDAVGADVALAAALGIAVAAAVLGPGGPATARLADPLGVTLPAGGSFAGVPVTAALPEATNLGAGESTAVADGTLAIAVPNSRPSVAQAVGLGGLGSVILGTATQLVR